MTTLTSNPSVFGARGQQYLEATREDGAISDLSTGTPQQQRAVLQQEYSHANQEPVDSSQIGQGSGFDSQLHQLRRAATSGWGQ